MVAIVVTEADDAELEERATAGALREVEAVPLWHQGCPGPLGGSRRFGLSGRHTVDEGRCPMQF